MRFSQLDDLDLLAVFVRPDIRDCSGLPGRLYIPLNSIGKKSKRECRAPYKPVRTVRRWTEGVIPFAISAVLGFAISFQGPRVSPRLRSQDSPKARVEPDISIAFLGCRALHRFRPANHRLSPSRLYI